MIIGAGKKAKEVLKRGSRGEKEGERRGKKNRQKKGKKKRTECHGSETPGNQQGWK